MQTINIGDVVLVNFPYEDNPNTFKICPAVIVNTNNNGVTAIALKITSAPPRDFLDYQLINWALAGLNKPSTVRTSKQIVITLNAIIKKLGALSEGDFNIVMKLYNDIN